MCFRVRNELDRAFYEPIYYDRNKTKSNLPFQMALYINLWLLPVWLLIAVINLDAKYDSLTNVYKTITLLTISILIILESLKLYLGYRGNLGGKIPELASCWLISTLIELPLETFLFFNHGTLLHYSETCINFSMICLLVIEILIGTVALKALADRHAKTFYLKQLYEART